MFIIPPPLLQAVRLPWCVEVISFSLSAIIVDQVIMVLGFRVSFPLLGGIFQVLIIVLFALLVDYGDHAVSPHRRIGAAKNQTQENLKVNDVSIYYSSKNYI